MKNDTGKRNAWIQLDISVWSATEFFEGLSRIYPEVERLAENTDDDADYQKYKELRTFQRALWIALIIAIGRLFDTFERSDKKVISLKRTGFFVENPEIKKRIDVISGDSIISRIIQTRNNYTAHLNQNEGDVISISEVCNSNIGKLLSEVEILVAEFSAYQKNEKAI